MAYKNKDGIYIANDSIECDRYSFEGSAESIKSYIDAIVSRAKEAGMIGDGSFDFTVTGDRYDGYDLDVYYLFTRVESEKEKVAREKAEEASRKAAAEKRKAAAEKKKLKADAEYAEFLRLKEKFGVLEK